MYYVAGQHQRFREDVLPQQRVCHDRVSHPSRARLTTRHFLRTFAPHSILTCTQYAVGSGGTVEVQYSKGGVPVVLVPDSALEGSGLCGHELATGTQSKGSQGIATDNGVSRQMSASATPIALVAALLMGAASLAL